MRRDRGIESVALAAIVAAALVPPIVGVLSSIDLAAPSSGIAVALTARDLVTTAWAVAAIALVATLLGWPVGWRMSRIAPRRGLIFLLPLLLPSYLAYAGWSTLRAPGTWLGDWLLGGFVGSAAAPLTAGTTTAGTTAVTAATNSLPLIASRLTAIVGLALWGWPIVAAWVAAGARAFPSDALDAMRLDGATARARALEVVRATWHLALVGGAVLALVMGGSAVPLHVAQLDTLAIRAWRLLDELPAGEHWRVWAACWPVVGIGWLGAMLLWRGMRRTGDIGESGEMGGRGGSGRLGSSAAVWTIWGASAVVPALLAAWSLRSGDSLWRFWRVAGPSAWASATIALATGAVAIGLAVLTWRALDRGGPSARAAGAALLASLVGALTPGVLIGAGAARGWALVPEWLAETDVPLVLAHVARFGAVGVMAGWWMWASEPRERRELRAMEAGQGWRAWWEGAGCGRAGELVAAGIVAGVLSLHEIESAVMLRPASSSGGGLAWMLLQWLHFARMEELSAGILWMFGVAVAAAGAAAGLARLGANRNREASTP
ncbi:MAG: hypothetical protein ACKVW3_17790 [Phycisphaerales bacterium]